jgi:UPF0716 protein FxsA
MGLRAVRRRRVDAVRAGRTVARRNCGFLWILATAALGALLVRREGVRAIEKMRAAMRERRAPEPAVPDRGMVATGGLLLILPGLLTDVVGLLMVVPATRQLVRRLALALGTALVGGVGRGAVIRTPDASPKHAPGPVIRGEVLDSRDGRQEPQQ